MYGISLGVTFDGLRKREATCNVQGSVNENHCGLWSVFTMSKFWAPARMVFVTVSSTNAFIPVQSTKFNQVASARLCFLIDLEITEKTKNMKLL